MAPSWEAEVMTLSLAYRSPMGLLAIMAVTACASQAAADTQSVRSGNWSDSATWDAGVPSAADTVTISAGDTVTFDLASTRVSGVTVEDGATLTFRPDRDATLETDENVLVFGRLEMRPQAPNNDGWRNSVGEWRPYFIHTLRFVDVDERAFVGGGMDPVASDVGLWVRGDGVLALEGARKTGWTRLAGAARAGDTSITLAAAPTGWRVGDVLSIVPTEHPDVGKASYNGFDVRTIGAIDGARIVFSDPLDRDHPDARDPFTGKVHTAEVLNLSRNVRIEGTGNGSASYQPSSNGRAHIHIMSGSPQSVRHAELALLGPRGPHDRDPTDGVPGRYPLHFHHSGDGSRGSTVEGVVVRQSGNRAFVPHASHGITFRDVIAYDVWEDAYWWDPGEGNETHDVLWDRAVAALVKDDPSFRGFRLAGFVLHHGSNMTLRNSVAVGVQGSVDASGFNWPEKSHGVWNFIDGNIAHNNKVDGIFVWQNDSMPHIIDEFVAYRNGAFGIDHGAYRNSYQYLDVSLFDNNDGGLQLHALPQSSKHRSDGYTLAFEDFFSSDRLNLIRHNQEPKNPVLFKDCGFSRVDVKEAGNPGQHDFVNCGLEPDDFNLIETLSGMRIRVQRANGSAYQIDHGGKVTTIPAFYDTGDDGNTDPDDGGATDPDDGATDPDDGTTEPGSDVSDTLGYWAFDEGSGTVASDSAGTQDGAIVGATWTSGQIAGALSFDGKDDHVDLGGLDVTGSAMTLTAWFRADAFKTPACGSSDCRIISKADGSGEGDHHWMLSPISKSGAVRLRFRLRTGGKTDTLIASSGNLSTGTWHHAAAVYDGSAMRLYLDGVEVGSRSKSGPLDTNGAVGAWIGGNPDGSRYWDGAIDDVRIYDRALSASEIAALHADG